MLPRLWDPGGVSSTPNTPRDLSRTIAPSRYPNALLTGYLINLPSLRRWQDLRTPHVKLDNFIHGNITGLTTAMKKITGSINVINPALTRPTPTHHEHDNPYDRQSSRTNFDATATSYIRVTQNLKRHVETASHTKDIPVAPSLHDSLILLPGYSVIHPGYPKYYHDYV